MSRKQKISNKIRAVLDVAIVTGGRFDMLAKCLDALYREAHTVPISIYLVDNATDKEEYKQNAELFIEREGSSVVDFRVKHLTQNTGFAVANNEGSRMGMAPLILFLNDDVELQEGAIVKIVQSMQDETVGICGIKLMFPTSSVSPIRPAGKVQHVGMALNIRGEPVHPLIGWSADHPLANISRDVLFVTGACLCIRRKLFLEVGGFDPIYGAGTFEDTDICFKVLQRGKRVYLNVSATGCHYTGSTVEKKKVGFPIGQNRMIFQTRWGNSGLMRWTDWEFL